MPPLLTRWAIVREFLLKNNVRPITAERVRAYPDEFVVLDMRDATDFHRHPYHPYHLYPCACPFHPCYPLSFLLLHVTSAAPITPIKSRGSPRWEIVV